MSPPKGWLPRRSAASLVVGALCLLATLVPPARADEGAIVVVSRSQFVPGDIRNKVPVVMQQGHDLLFTNADGFNGPHSLSSDTTDLFDSGSVDYPGSVTVDLKLLPPGTYQFHCNNHPGVMFGTLVVV